MGIVVMDFGNLFDALDLYGDGALSREELYTTAVCLGWHWREAPVFAVLDLLSILESIPKKACIAYLKKMAEDPLGPYGKVLLHAPYFFRSKVLRSDSPPVSDRVEIENQPNRVGQDKEASYCRTAKYIEELEVSTDHGALLIIDPQQSFTKGAWVESIGPQGEEDVLPIRRAFENCARLLGKKDRQPEIMFTRCPFPPDSYRWNDLLAGVMDSRQLYFIKPGNNVLFPPTNGFREWVERCLRNGRQLLVMGGCTINSCLRVSSIETQNYFQRQGVQVVVDLSLSGARARNFKGSSVYGGRSAVDSAVREMMDAGVLVARHVVWNAIL